MNIKPEFTLAAIQASPFYFDPERSTEKACQLIGEAATSGAALAAFGENWLPGYPWWVWAYSSTEWREAHYAYIESGVAIPSVYTNRLCQAAGDHDIDIVIGVAEQDRRTRGTIYNTLLFIGREGKILGRHRKLKPTSQERLVWGEGDGAGLRVYQRPYARIGGLNCWEHSMMLPAYALIAQGMQIHIAAWPFSVEGSGLLLTRALAVQGSCFAIGTAATWDPTNVPEQFRLFVNGGIFNFKKSGAGGSCIINPKGEVIAEAPINVEAILTHTVSLQPIVENQTWYDIGGHYSRPDVLQLRINRTIGSSVKFVDDQGSDFAGLLQPEADLELDLEA